MQAALTERDTLINASQSTQGDALGYGQHLGLQPAPIIYCAFVQIGSYKMHLFLTFSAALACTKIRETRGS